MLQKASMTLVLKYQTNNMYNNNFFKNISYKFFNLLPDKLFIQLKFFKNFHRLPNLKNPKTFSEKLQWLKLYDRNPYYTKLVDKYEVKKIVADIIGKKYIIPTLGVWDKAEDIDFDTLPNQFVLKATHDSGRVIICKDKEKLDKEWAKKEMAKSLKRDFYALTREWPYKNVPRRIIAEEFMEDAETKELRDYKFFCINGKVELLFIATGRQTQEEPYFDFFDTDYNHLPFKHGHPNAPIKPIKPKNFDLMKIISEKLSLNLPQIRVDLYEINGNIYFGELTLFHHSGMVQFDPPTWDYQLGELLKLPQKQ